MSLTTSLSLTYPILRNSKPRAQDCQQATVSYQDLINFVFIVFMLSVATNTGFPLAGNLKIYVKTYISRKS